MTSEANLFAMRPNNRASCEVRIVQQLSANHVVVAYQVPEARSIW
jgi:hypothetical protein